MRRGVLILRRAVQTAPPALHVIRKAFEIALVFPTQLELGRVSQLQEILTVPMWAHRCNTVPIHDCRAMHSDKSLGIEQIFEVLHRAA